MIEYKLEGVDKDIHCLFCGTRVGYDENGELGECNHLVYCSSGDESSDIEAYNDLFKNYAEDEGYDLVEVSPDAKPPVCKIIDYGKLKYKEQKSKKEAKKKQKTIEVNEIKMRPGIDTND